MRSVDPVVVMIGLLESTAPRLPEPAAPRARLGIGDIVFVMQGDDVHGVHERALRFGAHMHVAPHERSAHEFQVRGADGRESRMTSLSLWDPDDYFIEYNQRHG
ncbi:MAG: hypothetical protein IT481_15860 [Gammaproteobacteria bacterium]|nr:hypothetical protein [Gammaproteobacteria bacterium]